MISVYCTKLASINMHPFCTWLMEKQENKRNRCFFSRAHLPPVK
ncbi:hypothetical protein HanXRQr2_Chr16g0770071 [Helianthus annuus]|uniref:Uncharacterized protein n=1 Tax=Helianthus annuus TaxID=4232 RepID=A0A9K3DWK2_HELAN|nr:hypothetical protein HanXRQr2_Chr16g0770071 [Helianthus annuus]KAJ0822960.1 hypothetical protein HanPSC8_Chr16g0738141 [Helianthus annuus]